MATVELKGVRKSYGTTPVIHGVDIAIADGELVVIVGPSGCGKSTLLRMVAGLEPITEGTIAIDGAVVNQREPKDRDIAMVFQNYALYPHMTVYDNMAYGLRNRGMAKDEIDKRVRGAAETLELAHLLERKPRQLSGGQRQRVAMGRAIVREPKAFLFDEPLSNLDAKLRVQMRVEIKKLQRQLGVTSLYVTHDQVEAMTMADRLIVLNAGVAEQIGTPMELYLRPATAFVAGFIGSPAMNFLPGRLEGGVVTLAGGARIPVNGAAASAAGDITVGIRPEHVEAGAAGAPLKLKVELVEHLGAESLVYGRLDGGEELTARIDGEKDIAAGAVLALGVTTRHLHLFDRAGGKRLN